MFGAGCFWGVESAFRKVRGVVDTSVGYSGGTTADPTYQDVCEGRTGHTEVVQVLYDTDQISYDDLLHVFWNCHIPTQVNRQGPDYGYQYRSVIFVYDNEQELTARASKENLQNSKKYAAPIATAIEPAKKFYRAEEYHQRYEEKHGIACHL